MKISFCQTCKNRLYQLRQTIFKNLESIKRDKNSELILVNYNDTEGLDNFIKENFLNEIENKSLVYLREYQSPYFEMSKAKNLAHFAANGDFLFNLDADNFINNEIDAYRDVWTKYPNAIIHGLTNYRNTNDGSYGRIGLSRDIFNKLGGYDEDFIGIWFEDTDLIRRCLWLSLPYCHITSEEKVCLPNTREEGTQFTKFKHFCQDDYYMKNRSISIHKMKNNQLIRNLNRQKVPLIKNFIEQIEI